MIKQYQGQHGKVIIREMTNIYLHNALCFWYGVIIGQLNSGCGIDPEIAKENNDIYESLKTELHSRQNHGEWDCDCLGCKDIE